MARSVSTNCSLLFLCLTLSVCLLIPVHAVLGNDLAVRRYSKVHPISLPPFEENQLDDIAFFPSLVTFIGEALGESSINKLVSLNGRPLTTIGQIREVLVQREIIALSGFQRFYWPFIAKGHQHSLDGMELDRKEFIKVVSLSDEPRVLLVENLLSAQEADEIVSIAGPLKRSVLVLHKHEDLSEHEQVRTSTGRFIPNHEHATVMLIAARVANLTRSDIQWAEDMQVIHYDPMQHYHAHYDYIDHSYDVVANRYPYDNRYVTVLFYLSDVTRGGGTVFPMTNPNWNAEKHGYGSHVCDESFPALRVQPNKGNAVIFYNMDEALHPQGIRDDSSLHGGCDPLEGDKWAANYWIHNYYWHNKAPTDMPGSRNAADPHSVVVEEALSSVRSSISE